MFVHYMNELIVKCKVATCHYTEQCHVIAKSPKNLINYNIQNLQFTAIKRAMSI